MDKLYRYLEKPVFQDLGHKMVFLGGPRQVGKTTMAKMVASRFGTSSYLNWDFLGHRKTILAGLRPPECELLVLDEIHKYPRWKGLVKGMWDTRRAGEKILVTGSSKLDAYRKGGDSMPGRYHFYRLHPFTAREIEGRGLPAVEGNGPPVPVFSTKADLSALLRYGGFPEPATAQNDRAWRRWRKERFDRVFREDIRETEQVRMLGQVELLAGLLPGRVGSPLSLRSLSGDVETSPKTVKSWLDLMARNYYIFSVPPYHKRLERALKKEAKYYLWDWSEVENEGARFENMVAVHLLKWCHFWEDTAGFRVELFYLRDMEKREVDFLVVWERKPWLLVECRISGEGKLTSLSYFGEKLGLGHRYLVTYGDARDLEDRMAGVRLVPASRFLMGLV